jgi:hypothetical protein
MLMKIIGSRQRSYLDDNTNKKILIIRRLKCENCNKIHHELPSFLLPYKRHRVETIQLAIDDPKALIKNKNVGAAIPYVPETTIRKIKLWAEVFLQYAFECVRLRRLRYPVANEPPPPSTPEELRQGANWLAKLVVEVANFFPWKKDAR